MARESHLKWLRSLPGVHLQTSGHCAKPSGKLLQTTPELADQFNERNQQRMRDGAAPFAPDPDTDGRSGVWELHHSPAIGRGWTCL